MQVNTYPGVQIVEAEATSRTIAGVSTAVTAFVGRALRGPLNEPTRVFNLGEYKRIFGDLWSKSNMGHAVQQFFLNGGGEALVVRVAEASAVESSVQLSDNTLFKAANPGTWGDGLRVTIDHNVGPNKDGVIDPAWFNLFVTDTKTDETEEFRNVSVNSEHLDYVHTVLKNESELLRVDPATLPGAAVAAVADAPLTGGSDGSDFTDATQILGDPVARSGLYALEKVDLFNILCLPPPADGVEVDTTTWSAAAGFCHDRRAILLVDSPAAWSDRAAAAAGITQTAWGGLRQDNAVLYFPRIKTADPLKGNRVGEFVPCGAIAGVIARTDKERGFWKAPAGREAGLRGVVGFSTSLTDDDNGVLNPLAVNCLRSFRDSGPVVWGARTLVGSDQRGSQWKYLPVRRTALYIEESLYRGTQWVVFEPNDEALWAQIRLTVGTFMQDLFKQGAFAGKSPKQAYFVKCDAETTTPSHQARGIVNIHVGFAPLRPAEFVVITLSQKTAGGD